MNRVKVFRTLLFNTFQKEWRNRGFIVLAILTVLLIALVTQLAHWGIEKATNHGGTIKMSDLENMAKVALGGFYLIISIYSGLLGALIGVNAVRTDYESRVISQILSFPIHRQDYLLSRVLGAWLLVVLYYVAALVLAVVVFSAWNHVMAFHWGILVHLAINCLSILFYVLMGVLFSLTLPKILGFLLSAMLGFFAFIADKTLGGKPFGELFQDVGFFKGLGLLFYFLVPHVGNVGNISDQILGNQTASLSQVLGQAMGSAPAPEVYHLWFEAGHYALVMIGWWFLTSWVFRRSNQEMG